MSTDESAPTLRDRLREAKAPHPDVPALDPDVAPADPRELVREWLIEAVEAGVPQPQAMTLATVDASGAPASRVVLLKDVDDDFWFASSSLSPKGRQIEVEPRVALSFFWSERGRQIRVTGRAVPGSREASRVDFTSRHPQSRAVAVALPQSSVIADPEEARRALDDARSRIDADQDSAPDDWTAYRVEPASIEFWQATSGRDQVRLRYDREGDSWTRASLWP